MRLPDMGRKQPRSQTFIATLLFGGGGLIKETEEGRKEDRDRGETERCATHGANTNLIPNLYYSPIFFAGPAKGPKGTEKRTETNHLPMACLFHYKKYAKIKLKLK